MWRGLDRSFTRALEREGVPVQDTAGIYTKVLFRRKRDNADGGDWLDAYTRQEDGFKAGDLLAVGGDNYLLVQRDHRENGVYSRFNAVRCNQTITLGKWVKSTEPNDFGEYLNIFTPYATTPAYMVTQLTGLNKTVIGSVLGGTVAVIMPAYPIDVNVPVKCHYIDPTMEFVEREFTVESMDCADVNTDAEGNIGGILRLQIKLSP